MVNNTNRAPGQEKKPLTANVSINDDDDVITIFGIKYHGDLFRGLGIGVNENEYFQIINRDDGALTIQVTQRAPFDGRDEVSGD